MLEVLYGFLLSIFHFYNDECTHWLHRWREEVVSLAAGVSIAYLFLLLLPELYEQSILYVGPFIVALVGFTLFHVVEKHVYQHKSKDRILKELKEVHSVAFFIYHLLIGVTLYFFVQQGFLIGLVFFIPIFLHSTLSNISFSEIHHHIKGKKWIKILLSLAPLFGVLLPRFVPIHQLAFAFIFAFVVGALLYVVVRDSIPKGTAGHASYFVMGAVGLTLLLLGTGQL